MSRKGDLLKSHGIKKYEDMKNPELNKKMAQIIYNEQGHNAWYGSPYHPNNKEKINAYYNDPENVQKLINTKPGQMQYGVPTSLNGLHEYPGQTVNVPANDITMKGIDQPVLAIPNNDLPIIMQPNQDYKFPNSNNVTEIPMNNLFKPNRYQYPQKYQYQGMNQQGYLVPRGDSSANRGYTPEQIERIKKMMIGADYVPAPSQQAQPQYNPVNNPNTQAGDYIVANDGYTPYMRQVEPGDGPSRKTQRRINRNKRRSERRSERREKTDNDYTVNRYFDNKNSSSSEIPSRVDIQNEGTLDVPAATAQNVVDALNSTAINKKKKKDILRQDLKDLGYTDKVIDKIANTVLTPIKSNNATNTDNSPSNNASDNSSTSTENSNVDNTRVENKKLPEDQPKFIEDYYNLENQPKFIQDFYNPDLLSSPYVAPLADISTNIDPNIRVNTNNQETSLSPEFIGRMVNRAGKVGAMGQQGQFINTIANYADPEFRSLPFETRRKFMGTTGLNEWDVAELVSLGIGGGAAIQGGREIVQLSKPLIKGGGTKLIKYGKNFMDETGRIYTKTKEGLKATGQRRKVGKAFKEMEKLQKADNAISPPINQQQLANTAAKNSIKLKPGQYKHLYANPYDELFRTLGDDALKLVNKNGVVDKKTIGILKDKLLKAEKSMPPNQFKKAMDELRSLDPTITYQYGGSGFDRNKEIQHLLEYYKNNL
jgi:hypothetical protein